MGNRVFSNALIPQNPTAEGTPWGSGEGMANLKIHLLTSHVPADEQYAIRQHDDEHRPKKDQR